MLAMVVKPYVQHTHLRLLSEGVKVFPVPICIHVGANMPHPL